VKPRELLVLRRDPGYLRVHVPPLLYVASLAGKLEAAVRAIPGVRRVLIDRHRARIAVYYDRWTAEPARILVALNQAASPLMGRMEPEAFALAFDEQDQARRERIAGKAAQGAYLGLLGWAHWHVLRWAVRNPANAWWVWALVGFGIYTHRHQIRRIPQLSG
jgi:hypothetical protein